MMPSGYIPPWRHGGCDCQICRPNQSRPDTPDTYEWGGNLIRAVQDHYGAVGSIYIAPQSTGLRASYNNPPEPSPPAEPPKPVWPITRELDLD